MFLFVELEVKLRGSIYIAAVEELTILSFDYQISGNHLSFFTTESFSAQN